MNIFVGNLALRTTEDEVRRIFAAFGQVTSVTLMNDKCVNDGELKGYGYVEMPSKYEGNDAIIGLEGRTLRSEVINAVGARPLTRLSDRLPGEKGGH